MVVVGEEALEKVTDVEASDTGKLVGSSSLLNDGAKGFSEGFPGLLLVGGGCDGSLEGVELAPAVGEGKVCGGDRAGLVVGEDCSGKFKTVGVLIAV